MPPSAPGFLSAHDIAVAAAALLEPGESAWLVGGSVRDLLLHRVGADIDLAVDGDCERLARRLADRLGGSVFSFSERFLTWRIVVAAGVGGGEAGGGGVAGGGGMAGEGRVDLAPLRSSSAPGSSGATIDTDLAGRDFTVNAIARPVGGGGGAGGGELVDPLRGRDDLRSGVLRACSGRSFADDPLRVLRLARLEAELGLAPTAETQAAAAAAAADLASVSGERVMHELSATLALPAAAAAVRRLADLGALAVVLPEVDLCRGVTQNPYHHLDVFDHTLEALEHLPGVVEVLGGQRFLAPPADAGLPGEARLTPLAWAVLLHDVGKPDVRTVAEDGRITFWHHDGLGAARAMEIAARLRASVRFQEYVAQLIREHLRLGFLVRDLPLARRALVRYRRAVEPFAFEAIALSLADRMATRGERNPPISLARHFRIARDVFGDSPPSPPRRLLAGEDVMALLGIAPGPDVGAALEALQEEVDCGEVADEARAREFVRVWWRERRRGAPRTLAPPAAETPEEPC